MRKNASGFTIVELLTVIVVISILASITVVAFSGAQARARDAQRDAAVSTIKTALELYKMDTGGYPTPCANVNADCHAADLASYLSPAYVSTLPVPAPVKGNWSMFYNNGGTTTYTMLIFYESKPSCKTGVGISMSYYSSYPLCSNP